MFGLFSVKKEESLDIKRSKVQFAVSVMYDRCRYYLEDNCSYEDLSEDEYIQYANDYIDSEVDSDFRKISGEELYEDFRWYLVERLNLEDYF